jgi:hypothetical protein
MPLHGRFRWHVFFPTMGFVRSAIGSGIVRVRVGSVTLYNGVFVVFNSQDQFYTQPPDGSLLLIFSACHSLR